MPVRTVARVQPAQKEEPTSLCTNNNNSSITLEEPDGKSTSYSFDAIYDYEATQEELYTVEGLSNRFNFLYFE
jgi:hypothetical protein